jgi:hypothetical protein
LNFSKIRGDIRKSRCTTGINDTGGKFATGVNDTGGKFCHRFLSVVDTGGKNNGNNYQTAKNLK